MMFFCLMNKLTYDHSWLFYQAVYKAASVLTAPVALHPGDRQYQVVPLPLKNIINDLTSWRW